MPNRDGHRVVSILIGHPNDTSCELLAHAFKRQSCFRVVALAATTAEVLEAIQSFKVDVALINVELQDGPLSGFVALRKMLEYRPAIRPVMLLPTPDPHLVVDSFRAGAKGVFCPSQSQFKTLCRCVNRVHAGQIWANSSELAYVMEAFAQLSPLRILNADGLKLLAKREEDVVRLVADGLTNRDIACELRLSEHTVKNYLFHIFDKLGVSSRVELALCAVSRARTADADCVGERVKELVEASPRELRAVQGAPDDRRFEGKQNGSPGRS
jgi:DNA-binding NarL/FixJ family response regulator